MSKLLKAWKDIDGELIFIEEGQSGEGIIGPGFTRVPSADRVVADDLSVSEDYALVVDTYDKTAVDAALALKYDGSNPDGYETPMQLNARDVSNRSRINHTGSQIASTISDFASTVRSTVLSGLSIVNSLVTSSDSVLVAIGKLQGQLNAAVFGRDFTSKTKIASESTTGSTPSEYDSLTFTVSDTATNKFRINADFQWGHNAAGNDIRVFLLIDGAVVTELRIEPKDAGTDQRFQNNILEYSENLSIGTHTASIEYRPASSGRVSYMYRSIIEAWRVE